MNVILAVITLSAFVVSLFLGKAAEISNAAVSGAAEAVSLCLKLTGGLVFWSGMIRVAQKSGICDAVSKLVSPIIKLIFPRLKKTSKAASLIAMNITANLLGLGNAATPFGIEAMKELSNLNGNKQTPSDYMVCFAVINSASIQVLPTTLSVIRAAHGCKNPMDILPAILLTSTISLAVGLLFAKILPVIERKKRR